MGASRLSLCVGHFGELMQDGGSGRKEEIRCLLMWNNKALCKYMYHGVIRFLTHVHQIIGDLRPEWGDRVY